MIYKIVYKKSFTLVNATVFSEILYFPIELFQKWAVIMIYNSYQNVLSGVTDVANNALHQRFASIFLCLLPPVCSLRAHPEHSDIFGRAKTSYCCQRFSLEVCLIQCGLDVSPIESLTFLIFNYVQLSHKITDSSFFIILHCTLLAPISFPLFF